MRHLLLLSLFVLFLACTDVEKGTVIKKDFTPAWTQYVQTCIAYDRKGFCSLYTFTPVYWPDEYSLKLRDDSQDRPVDQRDTGWVQVPEETYVNIHLGDQYS